MTAFEWAKAENPTEPPSDLYCQTRDVAQARVEKTRLLLEKVGWTEDIAASITAIIGELANNSFDHNLGMWQDLPGCWLEIVIQSNEARAIVADRGQGILSSLKQVRPDLRNHQEALLLAFTKEITGRAPEHRGNGLKFVIRSLNKLSNASFVFQTGDAELAFIAPIDTSNFSDYIKEAQTQISGMFAQLILKKI